MQSQISGQQARQLASHLLKAVLRNRQPFDEAFAASSAKAAFSGLAFRDRAFARAIAATGLRRLGQIEDMLGRFLEKPLPADAFEARFILIAGAAQLAFMEVAPHAAIDLAVEQAKGARAARHLSGLINAVLRRVNANKAEILAEQDASRLNTPEWLWRRWVRHYGDESATRIAAAHLEEPPLDLSVKADAAAWGERLSGSFLPWGTVRLYAKGRVEDLEGYDEGAWWVQDAAAAFPARLLGDVRGLRVADLCAAPGGKTAQLAAHGAHVTAVDISAPRLRRLRDNLARLNLKAETVQANVSEWTPPERFDAVLLDAPCSATGTIRRNPDIAYLKSDADIAALAAVQAKLLNHALGLLAPGGHLVYATCSLEPEEGEEPIQALLAEQGDVALLPIQADEICLPPDAITHHGMLRTLPFHMGGMDGFFAARLAAPR